MTFLTAKSTKEGIMFLTKLNPYSFNSEVQYRRENNEWNAYDDFEQKNTSIIALFPCKEGEQFVEGVDVRKTLIPTCLGGYNHKAKALGLDQQWGYEKLNLKARPPYWDNFNLPFKELHQGIHDLVEKHGWKDFYFAAKQYNEIVTKSNYKIPTP